MGYIEKDREIAENFFFRYAIIAYTLRDVLSSLNEPSSREIISRADKLLQYITVRRAKSLDRKSEKKNDGIYDKRGNVIIPHGYYDSNDTYEVIIPNEKIKEFYRNFRKREDDPFFVALYEYGLELEELTNNLKRKI